MASTIDQIPGGTGGSGPTILDSGSKTITSGNQITVYTTTSNCYIHVWADVDMFYNINATAGTNKGFLVQNNSSLIAPYCMVYTASIAPRIFLSGGMMKLYSGNGYAPPITVLLAEGDYLSAYNNSNTSSAVHYMAYI